MGDESYLGRAQELFDEFMSSSTCRAALWSFNQLCENLQLDTAERPLYRPIKRRLNYWKANTLWAKLDRRAAQQEYQKGQVCSNTTCVIIGAGPCGLRTAVELGFMGARVVLLEKRDSFSRNNVLHLWPFTINDLRGLGAKKFYGKFCAGSIDHISIRQLQLVLLKVALLLGVEVHVNVEFRNLVEPPEDQHTHKVGWRMEVRPKSHPVNQLEFDVIIGADGRRNTLPGFRRKEFRGKLAIAITANFKNRNTTAEAKVEEISGVAFIFNQRFFQELQQQTGIDLENIVYYKDDTHYFVMTAKKQSLLEKGVIVQDFADTELLLSQGNVDQNALQMYARQAADFSTNHQLPSLDFAMNHYGQPDVAMFDFTCMYASENAAMVRQRHGHQLLVTLVGDSLLEPFWPMGTGIARGFLAALDSAWMIRSWSQGGAPLDVLAERESVYRLLHQTSPENLQKNFSLFTIDPTTRYVNANRLLVTPAQVRNLVDTGQEVGLNTDCSNIIRLPSPRFLRQDSFSQSNQLLTWCQEQICGYRGVAVSDLTTSWKSGLALCALIHRYRPDLIDFDSLDELSVEENTRLGFDVAERELGISPLLTVEEMSSVGEPDSLSMVMYLSQFYQLLKDTHPPAGCLSKSSDLRSALITPAFLLSRLGLSPSKKRNPKEQKDAWGKRRKTSAASQEQQESCDLNGDIDSQVCDEAFEGGSSRSRVRLMANQLQAKLDESSTSAAAIHRQRKRTLQQEQMSFRFKQKIKSQDVLSEKEQICIGGASSLAEQITNQMESQEAVIWDLSVSQDLSVCKSSGCSHVCFFCQKRLYVMERMSAEGFFFHRSCFQCYQCRNSLRLNDYAFDQQSGRFYCLQHSRLTVRSRVTVSDEASSQQTSTVSLVAVPSLSSVDSLVYDERRRSSAVSVMMATPERIELENCGWSSMMVEPEEVSEEMLNHFNLSLDEKVYQKPSSESEMEGEEEEQEEGNSQYRVSEVAKISWRETLQLHLRDKEEEQGSSEMEPNEEEEFPLTSQSVTSAAGNDITYCATLVEPDSRSSPLQSSRPPPETSPTGSMPFTDSFIKPGSTPDNKRNTTLPTHVTPVVMETDVQRHAPCQPARGKCLFDDNPELPQKKHLVRQWRGAVPVEEAGSEGVGRRRHKGANSLPSSHPPSLQSGGGALLLLKGHREALPTRQVQVEGGGARALWRTVFSGNGKETKKKQGRTSPAGAKGTNQRRATDVRGSLTDETDLDSSAMLQRCSLTPQNNLHLELCDLMSEIQSITIKEEEDQEPLYVPHALAFKRAYAIKRRSRKERVPIWDSDGQSSCPTEVVGVLFQPKEPSSLSVKETMFQMGQEDDDEDLDVTPPRRVQRAARRRTKQEQLKRLLKAQMIQRQLQQVEEKQRRLEERGVKVEKTLRGEADYWGDSNDGNDIELHLAGLSKRDNPALMQQWFQLVQQKNSLVRYESELIVFARELELEDRQSRLQQELRERMAVDDHLKEEWQLMEERLILEEMLEVVEQRDSLLSLLEQNRLNERQEEQDLDEVMVTQ